MSEFGPTEDELRDFISCELAELVKLRAALDASQEREAKLKRMNAQTIDVMSASNERLQERERVLAERVGKLREAMGRILLESSPAGTDYGNTTIAAIARAALADGLAKPPEPPSEPRP